MTIGSDDKKRHPLIAVLLTLLTTGLGQLYVGEPAKAGFFYLCLLTLSIVATATPISANIYGLLLSLFLLLIFVGYAAFSAARSASRRGNMKLKRYQKWYVYVALGAFSGFIVVPSVSRISSFKTYRIPSGSMESAIMIGDKIFTKRLYYTYNTPKRGEVATFIVAGEADRGSRVARIIGLPGETLLIKNKSVFINGAKLDDPWGIFLDERVYSPATHRPRMARLRDNLPPVEIASDSVFLMGDNRDFSHDCRFIGPVKLTHLLDKALYVYWSTRWGRIGTRLDDQSVGNGGERAP
jgi:signal peptidase I